MSPLNPGFGVQAQEPSAWSTIVGVHGSVARFVTVPVTERWSPMSLGRTFPDTRVAGSVHASSLMPNGVIVIVRFAVAGWPSAS